MRIQKVFRSLVVQASVLAMLLIGFCAIPSMSYMLDTIPKIENVSLPGAYGATNNTAFVLDRYSIVAPFGPSTNIDEVTNLSQLDNNQIYLYDTKKPESSPKIGRLNNCYFPTKLVFDAGSNTVFVRGTEYVEVGSGSGLFESHEVLVHIRLNLEADGKPGFDPDGAVPIRIRGVNRDVTEDAPDQFVLGHGGNILVFTNGSLIFTYDVLKGDFYPVVIDNINPGNIVSYLGIDETSNTLTVATSRRIEGSEGAVSFTSDLYFYQLAKDGTVNLIRHLSPENFGEGIFLSAGSNAVVSWDPNTATVEYGYFMTNDGSVCVVDLKNKDGNAVIERAAVMPEFAQSGDVEPGPVLC